MKLDGTCATCCFPLFLATRSFDFCDVFRLALSRLFLGGMCEISESAKAFFLFCRGGAEGQAVVFCFGLSAPECGRCLTCGCTTDTGASLPGFLTFSTLGVSVLSSDCSNSPIGFIVEKTTLFSLTQPFRANLSNVFSDKNSRVTTALSRLLPDGTFANSSLTCVENCHFI